MNNSIFSDEIEWIPLVGNFTRSHGGLYQFEFRENNIQNIGRRLLSSDSNEDNNCAITIYATAIRVLIDGDADVVIDELQIFSKFFFFTITLFCSIC